PERVSVRELAELLRVGPPVVLKELLGAGLVATVNRELDRAAASLVARNLGFQVEEADAANGTTATATAVPTEAPPEP
ncbi:MAG: translation initiation factor IF-2 N-terminal domain-containing protein, partial [Chloroflexota bacterium]|nr:translation initiation factor IF-2 N-terminal domain-containing protein [Chloroflexota bacterium]